MADYEILSKYRKDELNKIENILKKSLELIAFIKVYGSLYDKHYNSFILNINNLSEHYLQNFNSDIIDRLYNVFTIAKEEKKSEQEIFEILRKELYNLPAYSITEVNDRSARHK